MILAKMKHTPHFKKSLTYKDNSIPTLTYTQQNPLFQCTIFKGKSSPFLSNLFITSIFPSFLFHASLERHNIPQEKWTNKDCVFVQLDRRPAYNMNSVIVSIFITRALHFITKSCAYLSSLSENPLFSSILTIHILLFLYFPPFLLKLLLSPVTILAFLLIVALLRSGSPCQPDGNPNPEPRTEQATAQDQPLLFDSGQEIDSRAEPEFLPGSACLIDDSFMEWDVKAPLEVIYEEYEGQEEDEPAWNKDRPLRVSRLEKTSSLEVYYPETDSDTSSEGEFGLVGEMGWPEDPSISKWEGEDREGLIEIALDFGGGGSEKVYEDLLVEEDNMIEIDLSVGDD